MTPNVFDVELELGAWLHRQAPNLYVGGVESEVRSVLKGERDGKEIWRWPDPRGKRRTMCRQVWDVDVRELLTSFSSSSRTRANRSHVIGLIKNHPRSISYQRWASLADVGAA